MTKRPHRQVLEHLDMLEQIPIVHSLWSSLPFFGEGEVSDRLPATDPFGSGLPSGDVQRMSFNRKDTITVPDHGTLRNNSLSSRDKDGRSSSH